LRIDLNRENAHANRPASIVALLVGAPGAAAAIEALSYGAGFPLRAPVVISLVLCLLFALAVGRLIARLRQPPNGFLLDEQGVRRDGEFDVLWSFVIQVGLIERAAGIVHMVFITTNEKQIEYELGALTSRTRRDLDGYLRRHQQNRYIGIRPSD
jgi:hypothetical protein